MHLAGGVLGESGAGGQHRQPLGVLRRNRAVGGELLQRHAVVGEPVRAGVRRVVHQGQSRGQCVEVVLGRPAGDGGARCDVAPAGQHRQGRRHGPLPAQRLGGGGEQGRQHRGEAAGVLQGVVLRDRPLPRQGPAQRVEAVVGVLQVGAEGGQGAQARQVGQGDAEEVELGGEEPFGGEEVVADDDGVAEVADQVPGDLLESGHAHHPGVGDPVEFGVAHGDPRVDEGGVLVEDGAVAAHPYHGHLAQARPPVHVQAGRLQGEDGEGELTRVGSTVPGETAVVKNHGGPPGDDVTQGS